MFADKMYKQLNVEWTFTLLAIIALAIAPVPWIAYRFGEQWRKKESFDEGGE
jgi:hypothetical protein